MGIKYRLSVMELYPALRKIPNYYPRNKYYAVLSTRHLTTASSIKHCFSQQGQHDHNEQ